MTIILPQYVEINSVPLATYNCFAEDITGLLGATARGDNRPIPRVNGQRPYRHYTDELVTDINVFLRGHVDADGAPVADGRAALMALITSLRGSLFTPPSTTAGTHPAVLHLAGSVTLTADVQVPRFTPVRTTPTEATLVLQVVVPAGVWS